MINLNTKTYQSILSAMLDRIPDTYDKRDTSPIPTALGPAAWALEGFYVVLNSVQGQAFIQTATGENLENLAVIANLTRKDATPSVRLGVFNMPVPIGSRFSTINGADSINFTVTAGTGISNQYELTADAPGSAGNDYTGPILPITSIPGLTSASITSILIPGEDTEEDDAFRQRIISALREPGYGGNIANYRTWLEAIDGVGPAQIWPVWNGGGTVKLSILGADLLPASSQLISNVQNTIDPPPHQGLGLGLAPIGATVTVVAPTTVSVAVSATIALSAGYTIDQVRTPISNALDAYLKSVREKWGTPISTSSVLYNADVYISRVTAAILTVAGVLNVTGVALNGAAEDLILVESGATQQIPILGAVTLNE